MKTFYHRNLILTVLFLTAFTRGATAQDDVLMTVDGTPVKVSEFKRVYLKNLDLVDTANRLGVGEYLQLFKDYQLKLKEATAQGMDMDLKFLKELDGYKKELAQQYMSANEVTEALIKEAHDRLVREIRASHILVQLPAGAAPADTLKAYTKIMEARNKVVSGEPFEKVAKAYSEDPSAQQNGGDLGWFKAFRMVYDFENAAYNTPMGEVSMPFRTRFGYHIVQPVDACKSKGEVTIAHIMVATKQADSTIDPQRRIKELYQQLQQGEEFVDLARRFSDDKNSGRNGGKLGRYGSGVLSSEVLEKAAFDLENNGDISEPFETRFGWHIVKLLEKHPVKSLEEMRPVLEDRLKGNDRLQLAEQALNEKLRSQYGIGTNREALDYFKKVWPAIVEDPKNGIDLKRDGMDSTLITLGDESVTYLDFAKYLQRFKYNSQQFPNLDSYLDAGMKKFVDTKLREYHIENLANVNPEYAAITKEYRDGLLLFALMEKEIWNKAKEDTLGLKSYFERNREKYLWPKRVDVVVATSPNRESAQKAKTLLEKGVSPDTISKSLNSDDHLNIFFTQKTVALGDNLLPADFEPALGVSKVYPEKDFTVVQVRETLEPQPKELEEALGQVIADYQLELEREWMARLREKYPITVDKRVLKHIKKELKQ